MRLLLVAPRYPWPPRRGDQLRTAQHLATLAKHHEVTLLVPERPEGAPAPPFGVAVEFYRVSTLGVVLGLAKAIFGGWPLQAGLFYHQDLSRELRRLAPEMEEVVFVLARLALHLQDLGDTPVVLDFVDSLSLNFRRRARFDSRWRRPILRMEAKRLVNAERRIVEKARKCLVVGERDRDSLIADWPDSLAEKLQVVRVRVEPSNDKARARASSNPPTLVVTGNLGYFPTHEGLVWWLEEVWPLLRKRLPTLRVLLVGSRASRQLQRIARKAGVAIESHPEGLASYLGQAGLAVIPLRAGSGVPVKLLEAWSRGTPVVATPWAAAGAEARGGVECALCNEPSEWVEVVARLLADPEERRRLVEAGHRRLVDMHSSQAVESQLLVALD